MLKESNIKEVRLFIKGEASTIQGTKLAALYRLALNHGESVKGLEVDGKKVYQFTKGEYIGFTRKSIKDSFFPCVLKIHHLVNS